LPPFLLPVSEHQESTLDTEVTAPASALSKKKAKKSRDNTPRDSPAATEGESDEEEEVVGENGNVVKKKKKPGLGKAGGARRRKMAMK
jgi:hypothetical protein